MRFFISILFAIQSLASIALLAVCILALPNSVREWWDEGQTVSMMIAGISILALLVTFWVRATLVGFGKAPIQRALDHTGLTLIALLGVFSIGLLFTGFLKWPAGIIIPILLFSNALAYWWLIRQLPVTPNQLFNRTQP